MAREDNVAVFKDSMRICRDDPVFKSDTSSPVLLKESDRYSVDIITCAAPNLRDNPSNRYNTGDGNKAVKVGDKELLDTP